MICKKCKQEKENKKQCKNCKKLYDQENYQNNKEKFINQNKEYRINNKEHMIEYYKKYNNDYYENNKDHILQEKVEYNLKNRKKITLYYNKYQKNRKIIDPSFKLRRNCSKMIWKVLKCNKNNNSILNYLPYTMEDLKIHLEKQFNNKMSWDNYGTYWHLDHIYPQSLLPYTSMADENFKKCWDLSNLQPLEAIENIKKSNKVPNV